MANVIMPKMSDAMEEGKVIRWIKNRGDRVEKGEPIAEIETDKANVELEASDSGVLQDIKVPEGESVPIGTPIAVIGPAGEAVGAKGGAVVEAPPEEEKVEAPPEKAEAPKEEKPPEKVEERPAPPEVEAEAPPVPEGIKASPLARKIAQDAGVDLSEIEGTGPGGRIVESDVKEFIERGGKPRPPAPEIKPEAPPAPTPAAPLELAGKDVSIGNIWQTVGRRMTESKQQAPHFYVTMEVDMEETMRVREWLNSTRPKEHQISVNDIIVKACAAALVKHPMANASYKGENKIRTYDAVNIGIAVAVQQGLITPVVRNCEQKSLSEISDETRDLIERTRSGKIKPEEYSGATFTVSNMGMYGVEEFSAIIVPPQAVILAIGEAVHKAVVMDGTIEIRSRMRITASADHRVIDGARVAEFMRDVKQALEQPMSLLE